MPDAGSLRERKKQQTRRALETVAVELFAERGFDNVTIDEIVAAADVSKRTFYRYYEAKEDLLLGEHLRLLELLRAGLEARPPDEPLFDALRNALGHVRDEYGPDIGLVLDKNGLMLQTPSLANRMLQHHLAWEAWLAGLIAGRLGIDDPDDLRPPMMAAALLAALRIITQRWERTGGESLADAIERHLTELAGSLNVLE